MARYGHDQARAAPSGPSAEIKGQPRGRAYRAQAGWKDHPGRPGRDSGILHFLAGIEDSDQLETHPRCGASWEGFALEQTIQKTGAWDDQCYFWATHQGAELDLMIVRGRKREGFEFKYSQSPGMTPSMRAALEDLRLDHLWVVHPGLKKYPLGRRVEAIGLADLLKNDP